MQIAEMKTGILESAMQGIYSPTKSMGVSNEEAVETIRFLLTPPGDSQPGAQALPLDDDVVEGPEWPLVKKTIALYPDPNEMRSNQRTTITTIEVPLNPRSRKAHALAHQNMLRKIANRANCDPPLKSSNKLMGSQQHKQFSAKPDVHTQKENVQEAQMKLTTIDRKSAMRKLVDVQPVKSEVPKKQVQVPTWSVYRQILQTKSVEAPVRQERLPRKQKLQMPNRGSEEVVFQHVVVQSNGVVETKVNGVVKKREMLQPTDWVQLSDSEEDCASKLRKRNAKRENVEIVISDSEDASEDEYPSTNSEVSDTNLVTVDAPTNDNITNREDVAENHCSKCTKTFPSHGSLRTHLQHHTLEESKKQAEIQYKSNDNLRNQEKLDRESRQDRRLLEKPDNPSKCLAIGKRDAEQRNAVTPQLNPKGTNKISDDKMTMRNQAGLLAINKKPISKFVCEECKETFINLFLLRKHSEQHRSRHKHECDVCKKMFTNVAQLNVHSKSHVKKSLFELMSDLGETKQMKAVPPPKTCYTCQAGVDTKQELEEHVLRRRVSMRSTPRSTSMQEPAYLNTTPMLRTTARDKRKRLQRDSGIPVVGKMRTAYNELRKMIKEVYDAEAKANED